MGATATAVLRNVFRGIRSEMSCQKDSFDGREIKHSDGRSEEEGEVWRGTSLSRVASSPSKRVERLAGGGGNLLHKPVHGLDTGGRKQFRHSLEAKA